MFIHMIEGERVNHATEPRCAGLHEMQLHQPPTPVLGSTGVGSIIILLTPFHPSESFEKSSGGTRCGIPRTGRHAACSMPLLISRDRDALDFVSIDLNYICCIEAHN